MSIYPSIDLSIYLSIAAAFWLLQPVAVAAGGCYSRWAAGFGWREKHSHRMTALQMANKWQHQYKLQDLVKLFEQENIPEKIHTWRALRAIRVSWEVGKHSHRMTALHVANKWEH